VGRVEQLLYSYCSPLTSNVKLGTSCSTLPPEAIPPHTVVLRCLKLFYAVHSCSTLPTVALLYPLLLYSACSCSSLPTAALLCPQLFHSAHSRSTLPTAVLLCPQLFYSAHSCSTLLKLFYRTYSPTAPLLYVSVTRQPHRLFHDLPLIAPFRLCSAIRRDLLDHGNTPTVSLLPTAPRYFCFPTPHSFAELYWPTCRYFVFLETV
jgi:hypothetical protein